MAEYGVPLLSIIELTIIKPRINRGHLSYSVPISFKFIINSYVYPQNSKKRIFRFIQRNFTPTPLGGLPPHKGLLTKQIEF
jgi:hypothetical protein